MKKFLLGFLIFILVLIFAVIGFLFYLKIPLAVEKILPQTTVAYIKVSDVQNNANKFITMPVWQALLNLNYDILVENKIMTDEQKSQLEMIKQNQEAFINHFMFKKFLGQEITIAFDMENLDIAQLEKMFLSEDEALAGKFFSHLFFITRLEPEAQIAESLLKTLSSSLGQDVEIEFSKYKGYTIQTFITADKNIKVSMTRIKDLLVLGLGDKVAKSAIDVIKKEKKSLQEDADFNVAQEKFLEGSTLKSFIHLRGIIEKLEPEIKKMFLEGQEKQASNNQVEEVLENMNQFKTIALSAVFEDVAKIKVNIQKNSKSKNSEISQICSVRNNETISMVPSDALFYAWSSCLDLNYFWGQIKKELAKISMSAENKVDPDKIKAFEEKIGVEVEQDILPVFGKEIGGYLANIDIQKAFVLPEFLIFVEIQDQEKANALLDKLLGKSMFPLKDEKYADTTIHSMQTPFPKIAPAYCYLDKYFLIAMNQDLLKKSIDLYNQKNSSLVADSDFKSLDPGLLEKNIFSVFSRVKAISLKLKDIMDFVGVLAEAQDNKMKAFQSGSQKRIDDIKKNILKSQETIKETQKEQELLKDKIWDLEAAKLEVKVEQDKIKILEDKIQSLTAEVSSDNKTIEELNKTIAGYTKALEDSDDQKVFVREAVYPILNSFSFIHSFSARQNDNDQDIEAMLFIKTQK